MGTSRGRSLRNALKRFALLAPPLAFVLAALAILVASPFAWGVGREVGLPDWMTTLTGVALALPGLVIGGACLKETARRTRYLFSTHLFQLSAGLFFLTLGTALEAVLVGRIGNPETYESLRNSDGTVVAPSSFLVVTLIADFIFAGIVAATAYAYGQAITADVPTRYDRLAGEEDGVGEILRGRHSLQ